MNIQWINEWRSKQGSRDLTWFGMQSSSFDDTFYGGPTRRRFNIHIVLLGFGLVVWLQ